MCNMQNEKTQKLLYIIPFFIVLLVMLPRLLSPNFGLMDDGFMLLRSNIIQGGDFRFQYDQTDGRFRPLYWLILAFLNLIFNNDAFGYFVVFLLIFLLIILFYLLLLRKIGFSPLQATVAASMFALTPPIVENFFTLSKSEPQQLLWILISLFLIFVGSEKTKLLQKCLYSLGSLVFFILAALAKETSLIMIPIVFSWCLLSLLRYRQQKERKSETIHASLYLLIVITGSILYFLLRSSWQVASIQSGGYSGFYQLTLASLMDKIIPWVKLVIHDFPYLIPFSILIFMTCVGKNRKKLPVFFLAGLIWCVFWLAVFFPWRYVQEYFILAFALGVCTIIAGLLPLVLNAISTTPSPSQKIIFASLFTLAGILFILTLPNVYTNARLQIVIDEANQNMLQSISQSLPPDSMVRINIQVHGEYRDEVPLFLQNTYQRKDLLFDPVENHDIDLLKGYHGDFLLLPVITNQPQITVRQGVVESTQAKWNRSVLSSIGSQYEIIYDEDTQFRMIRVNFQNFFCLFVKSGYCSNPDPFIDFRIFSYGWKLLEIN